MNKKFFTFFIEGILCEPFLMYCVWCLLQVAAFSVINFAMI